ncbi:MAG: hypothetical protein JWS12_457 [Candidatus Saccharibacteria bacterium]|nr:hypothetical protein [Candidatus Saccharibacteria bacterium]
MRPQESRRSPDEGFYFDRQELVIHQALLEAEPYPEVICLPGRNAIANYRDADGEMHTMGKDLFWHRAFQPGSVITSVTTSDQEIQHRWLNDGSDWYFDEPSPNIYEIQAGDMLIFIPNFASSNYNLPDVLVQLAGQQLPGRQGDGWELEGIITADDKLVTWKGFTQEVIEWAVANHHLSSAVEYRNLKDQVGPQLSLKGCLSCDEAATAYLAAFAIKTGVDYRPDKDPRERVWPGGDLENIFNEPPEDHQPE